MKRKLMLIINPAAGRGSYKNNLGEALQILDNGGYRTSLFFTAGSGDATEYAARYGGDYDTVACIGGDGTLSEVISGLMRLEARPKLGYIPMGTANDVATTLGLPKNDTVGAAGAFYTVSLTPSMWAVSGKINISPISPRSVPSPR